MPRFAFVIAILLASRTRAEDPCQTCACSNSDDAHTITLNCTDRNLNHILGYWPNVTGTIIVSYAENDIITLEAFPETDAIIEIILSHANMKYLMPGLFVDAPNVKFLDFSHNFLSAEEISADKFKGPYNETFYEPIALEHLDLSHNQIHSLGKNIFVHMPNLKVLNLKGNDFRVLDVHTQLALTSLSMLQSLNLADNELTELIGGAIENHPSLTELNLAHNALDFVPSTLSIVGKSLETLVLDDNPIMEFVAETFLGLDSMIELSANNLTKLKFVNANTFASMPRLKTLRLSHNHKLQNIDREAFAANQSILQFYLDNNDLFRIDYKLLPWSKLQVFEFDDNPLECSCDLYNITRDLRVDITRREDGPFCMDPRTERYVQVFSLKSDICSVKSKGQKQREYFQHHFSVVRIALIILSVMLMLVALIAAILGVIRYRKYQRNLTYPYATQILYNPVSTTSRSKY